jgi:hypothetical protein
MSIEQGSTPEQEPVDYGSAEQLDSNAWRVGDLLITAFGENGGISVMNIHAEAKSGEEVTLNFNPRDLLQLMDVAESHRSMLERGVELLSAEESVVTSVDVRHPGTGPEPIPTNRSIRRQSAEDQE